jgi:hypothetical protein
MDKQELRERMRQILGGLVWEAASKDAQETTETIQVAPDGDNSNELVKIEDVHKKLLKNIAENPFLSITEHADALGRVSTWVMTRTIEELERIGFLDKPLSFSLGKRGNPRRYMRITAKGAEYVGVEFEKCRVPGKGSFEHCLYQDVVYRYLGRQGRSAMVEHTYNGKAMDVAEYARDGKVRAYEIELRLIPHVTENIRGDLDAGCSRVTLVTRNRTEQKKIALLVYSKLPAETLEYVSFKIIREFVE